MDSEHIVAVGLGAGRHAALLVEILCAAGVEIRGLLDEDSARVGDRVAGVAVLGGDDMLSRLRRDGVTHFFVGVGGAASSEPRRRAFERGLASQLTPLPVRHPSAVVSPSASLGRGTVLLPCAVINPGARLGDNVLVNTGAVVEHDCEIGDHVHAASGARITGGVRVGDGVHVGAGAVVREGVSIGAGTVVGAGAVVVRDVAPGQVVAGVPARPIRTGT